MQVIDKQTKKPIVYIDDEQIIILDSEHYELINEEKKEKS